MLPDTFVRQQVTFRDAKRVDVTAAVPSYVMARVGACVNRTRPANVCSPGVPRRRHLNDGDPLCGDLPTTFQPHIGNVLVTGATGYVGGRLVPELLARGYRVRAMVRTDASKHRVSWPGAEVVVADALATESLKAALSNIDTAYYLIHSLLLGPKEFTAVDVSAARNFRRAAEQMGVKRIIYLGGLGDVRSRLSCHLRSREEAADELRRGNVPATVLRAAVIVGSGSASYEIIKGLARNLRILPVPLWAGNRCQPIGIRDVIKYLVGVLETSETAGRSFDIGGRDILTYKKMLTIQGELLQKRVFCLPVWFSNVHFYAYVASLVTPVPSQLIKGLMEGVINDVVCRDDAIRRLIPFEPLSYGEAIARAMDCEEQNRTHTLWSQSDCASAARSHVVQSERTQSGNRRHWWVINRGGLMGRRTAHRTASDVNHVAVAS